MNKANQSLLMMPSFVIYELEKVLLNNASNGSFTTPMHTLHTCLMPSLLNLLNVRSVLHS